MTAEFVQSQETICVVIGNETVDIDRAVFTSLLSNSVASERAPFLNAIDHSRIHFSELIKLSRIADVPYSLFFAPLPLVEAQLKIKTDKLLEGVTKQTFSLNSRNTVDLNDIELIIKDLLRKQECLKRCDDSLIANPVVNLLRKPSRTINEDAKKLLDVLEIRNEDIFMLRNKDKALEYLISKLEAKQILVSQSANNYMPQLLRGIKFSGITIKDTKIPYIFLAGGDQGDYQEPTGRRIFTTILLTVLVSRGVFAPVTYDGSSVDPHVKREYRIVEEILMPSGKTKNCNFSTLDSIKSSASIFKVTPSALVVAGMHQNRIGVSDARDFLNELADEYKHREKKKIRASKDVNAIRKYNGYEFSRRMFKSLDAGTISVRNFCRVVTLNKIEPSNLSRFRAAIN